MSQFDVFGMCNALYDIQAEVDDSVLLALGLEKGSMALIDSDRQRELIAGVYKHLVNTEPGGSGCNTMTGVAQLGGTAVFTSRVGKDEHGAMFREKLALRGVKPNLGIGESDTGICLVLVTPDAQRTMCTYLGIGRELCREDVSEEDIRASKYLYVTGYLWDTDNQKEAVLHAMHTANKAGVKVALSLSDPFCVNRHKDDFLKILKQHTDVLFGNWHEAEALTDTGTPEEAARALAEHCDLAVVTLDEKGSLLRTADSEHRIPVYPVTAVDTTGAGDMYAAGLLYGLTHGLDLVRTGHLASWCAAQVVSQLGPRIETIDLAAVEAIKTGTFA